MTYDKDTMLHIIDVDDSSIYRALSSKVPRVGDEIRLGGEGSERYYEVLAVIWVYDEPDCPYERVNIGVEKINTEVELAEEK